jgi:1-acyl-sn-glycerol-3-phosphate acyltransferase
VADAPARRCVPALDGFRTYRGTAHLFRQSHEPHGHRRPLAALPEELRSNTRPVAAKDYWDKPGIRGVIARDELNVVMVDRSREDPNADPLDPLKDALEHGFSLIIFPEGTRSAQPLPGPFKSGLYHLASEFPQVELIPVYIENLHRSMPKGALLPVPIICTVRFGAALSLAPGEDKDAFLERARAAVIRLAT